jgi:hypothetical protein
MAGRSIWEGGMATRGGRGPRDTLSKGLLSVCASFLSLVDGKRQFLCPKGAGDQLAHHSGTIA